MNNSPAVAAPRTYGQAAVYRASTAAAWQDCELLGYDGAGNAVSHPVDTVWLPGVFLSPLDHVRLQGAIFILGGGA